MGSDMHEFNEFLRLTEEDLTLFALGSYQLKQARSYYGEHVHADGVFTIELAGDIPAEEFGRWLDEISLYYVVEYNPDILTDIDRSSTSWKTNHSALLLLMSHRKKDNRVLFSHHDYRVAYEFRTS